ncbi:hypothetical protein K3729_09660 [Rhodobacteraceae bacterium S2214]|nr:hypothetical protein K3729_09660 [Rhodobacteraceae bacterium S2214]
MNSPQFLFVVIAVLIGQLFFLRWLLTRRKSSSTLDAIVAEQGWAQQELPASIGKGAQIMLSDPKENWALHVTYGRKRSGDAVINWRDTVTQSGAVVVAPPLAPHVADIMKKTPDGMGASMVKGTMTQALKRLGDLPEGVELDRTTIGEAQGILLTNDASVAVAQDIYTSKPLATLRDALPRSAQTSVVLDGDVLSVRAETAPGQPGHLRAMVDAGIAMRSLLTKPD